MMNFKLRLSALAAAGVLLAAPGLAEAAQKVSVYDFNRAETDMTMGHYAKDGAFGKFLNLRKPAPVEDHKVARLNRDTLYSFAIFDLSQPVTIIKPPTGGRYQSMQIIDEDQYTRDVEYGAGEFTYSEKAIGTRYICVVFRTFADAEDPADIKAANALQDKIAFRQKSAGKFEVPAWDTATLKKLRDAINVLASTVPNAKGMFGDKSEVNPIAHLLGTAYGWGGLPEKDALYLNEVPKNNDGKTPYVLTLPKAVPVDGFFSVTIYNAKGFLQKNPYNAYSINNVTGKRNPDGTMTIRFGGDPKAANYLPIFPGWNYTVRMYRPKKEVLDGSWTFPKPEGVK
jgi:hypothetical protein